MESRRHDKTLLAVCSAAVLSAVSVTAAFSADHRLEPVAAVARTVKHDVNGQTSPVAEKSAARQGATAVTRTAAVTRSSTMTSPHVIGTTAAKVTTTQKAAKVAVQKKTSVPKKAGKTAVQSPRSGGQSGRPSALKQVYRDGTYVGVGQTRIGAVQVAVTLKHDRITDVKITGYTTHYPISYIDPILPQELLQRQDINKIDVVSGATLSTEDFYYAVQSALAQAKQAEQRAVNGKS